MNAQQRPAAAQDWLPDEQKWRDVNAISRPDARVISSNVLFNGMTEVIIEHGGSRYRLKVTRQNKLILNK